MSTESEAGNIRDLKSDTWTATDALGRALPGYDECGPPKKDRYVGIFYFLTHNQTGGAGPFDVTKIKAENPENPQWGRGAHFWGEPEYGYYQSKDPWVIRRHAQLLADAGVDTLIFDTTNNVTFPDVITAIGETFLEMRAEGEPTPQFCFLASEESIRRIWEEVYSKDRFRDLWFEWQGKPLLIFGQWEKVGPMRDVVLPDHIKEFFTIRESWAWTTLPWYDKQGHHAWPWVAHHPQPVGWDKTPTQAEHMPVTVGQHPLSNIGRSFHKGHQPQPDRYDITPFTDYGLCFQEQWDTALATDPEFIFVTGWNEWTAGSQVMGDNVEESLAFWDFFPGAQLGMAGRDVKPGETYFIDQYNQEYSRDAEPMKGGHTDNYYYQLWSNIRRYKGVRKPESPSPQKTIQIQGDFSQWDTVAPEYLAHGGNTRHRDYPGVASAGPYVNDTGRNDLLRFKVARDNEHVFFYAETQEPLSPHTDPFWMLLYIDADLNPSTCWEGYDYIVNLRVINEHTTTTQRSDGQGGWMNPVEIEYHAEGNKLMIAIPRHLIALSEGQLSFDFKWADHIQKTGDITEFFVNGDSAPPRRANYRFQAED